MARMTKAQKIDQMLLDKLVSQRMSFSGAQVNIFNLSTISKAAKDAWDGTFGAPAEERIAAATVAIDAAIAAVREN